MYFTTHPVEWDRFVVAQIGADHYERLKDRALQYKKMNLSEVYAMLKAEWKRLDELDRQNVIGAKPI